MRNPLLTRPPPPSAETVNYDWKHRPPNGPNLQTAQRPFTHARIMMSRDYDGDREQTSGHGTTAVQTLLSKSSEDGRICPSRPAGVPGPSMQRDTVTGGTFGSSIWDLTTTRKDCAISRTVCDHRRGDY